MTVRGSCSRHGAATNTQARHPLNWSSRGRVPTRESLLLNSRTHPRAHTHTGQLTAMTSPLQPQSRHLTSEVSETAAHEKLNMCNG